MPVLLWIVPARVEGSYSLPQGELVLKQQFQVLSGTLTTIPSSDAVIFIWQERREFGWTSCAKSSMSSSIASGSPVAAVQAGST